MQRNRYNLYATLLDGYYNVLHSEDIYERLWGMSDEPPCTPGEFNEQQRQSFIERINRIPFDSEAADRGTAFNEVIDCMIESRNSSKIDVQRIYSEDAVLIALDVTYNDRSFYFPLDLCREVADYYNGAITQHYVEADLPTRYGIVKLYGYIDELMPHSVHDIKTTRRYYVGKYRNNFQHLVYPYCLNKGGCKIRDFEYNVVEFGKSGYNTYTEHYAFDPERDIPRLVEHCEGLIDFIEKNRHLITDKKIFNEHE